MPQTPLGELLRSALLLGASSSCLQAHFADPVACNHVLAVPLGASLKGQDNFVFFFFFFSFVNGILYFKRSTQSAFFCAKCLWKQRGPWDVVLEEPDLFGNIRM